MLSALPLLLHILQGLILLWSKDRAFYNIDYYQKTLSQSGTASKWDGLPVQKSDDRAPVRESIRRRWWCGLRDARLMNRPCRSWTCGAWVSLLPCGARFVLSATFSIAILVWETSCRATWTKRHGQMRRAFRLLLSIAWISGLIGSPYASQRS